MATSPGWSQHFTSFSQKLPGQPARRLWLWPVVAALAACGSVLTIRALTADLAQHHWLHLALEISVASAAVAGGALTTAGSSNRSYRQFVETMAQALDARDSYTAGHGSRVAEYSHEIALALGFRKRAARAVAEAAKLHDIGKIGVPDAILQKTTPLTPEEIGMIRLHPQIGRKILERTGHFKKLLPVVELHHENWDGTGYPYGLRGEQVPLEARIVHVADAFDAMTSARCYRDTPGEERAKEELRRCSGTQFDPRITPVFLALIENGIFEETLRGAASELWGPGWNQPSASPSWVQTNCV